MLNNRFRINLACLLVSTPYATFSQEQNYELRDIKTYESPTLSELQYQTQCGKDDLTRVERYESKLSFPKSIVEKSAPSVVLIEWLSATEIREKLGANSDAGSMNGNNWCTGTLIQDKYILTAAHCFAVGRDNPKTPYITDGDDKNFLPSDVLATLFKVTFNYQKNGSTGGWRQGFSFPIIKLVENGVEIGNLDYAIVEVGKNAEGQYPSDRVSNATFVTSPIDMNNNIAVIQHPRGGEKMVDVGTIFSVEGNHIWYDNLDTFFGFSGAAILSPDGAIVGIHIESGCSSKRVKTNSDIERRNTSNEGITSESIAEISMKL